jgi:hypothetical protein
MIFFIDNFDDIHLIPINFRALIKIAIKLNQVLNYV